MRLILVFTLLFVGAAHAQQASSWTRIKATNTCARDLHRLYGDTLAVSEFMGIQSHENDTTLVGLVASDTRTEYKGRQVAVGCIYKQNGSLVTVFFNTKIANWVVPKRHSTTLAADTSIAKTVQPGIYYVKDKMLEERLAPNRNGSITNRIYRMQKVDVFEVKKGWARVSRYYDGVIEGKSGQVARWVLVSGLSASRPAELKQPSFPSDARIAKSAFPKLGESALTEKDLEILHMGALKYLNSGKCSRVEYGDKSIYKVNTYYINCGGPHIFFTPADVQ